jgi:hypothetical protein
MRRIRNLALCTGLASLVAVGIPAAAMAKTVTMPQAPDTCGGSVFSNVKLQNVASSNYAAESTVDDSLVLYTSTGQTWDGYRDPDGHLVIYRCGTNDVLTDHPDAKCSKGYASCAYVTPYNDKADQWWTRIVSGADWYLQSLDTSGHSYVLNDPLSTKAEGTHVVLDPYMQGRTNEEFKVVS